MIKIPSAACAAVTGLFITPLLAFGMNYIERHRLGQGAEFIWVVLTFFFPVLLSVTDFSYWRRRVKELGSAFHPLTSPEDFKQFYFPAWGRMLVWFIASAVSTLTLSGLGVLR